jgi:hypothetical protein
MSTKLLKNPALSSKLVTIIGDFILDTEKWNIPEEFQIPDNAPSTDFGVAIVRYQNKDYPIDKAGLNIGLPANYVEAIIYCLETENKLKGVDLVFIDIVSGDGTNIADYRLEDGKTIARFLQSKPTMVGKYKAFIGEKVI